MWACFKLCFILSPVSVQSDVNLYRKKKGKELSSSHFPHGFRGTKSSGRRDPGKGYVERRSSPLRQIYKSDYYVITCYFPLFFSTLWGWRGGELYSRQAYNDTTVQLRYFTSVRVCFPSEALPLFPLSIPLHSVSLGSNGRRKENHGQVDGKKAFLPSFGPPRNLQTLCDTKLPTLSILSPFSVVLVLNTRTLHPIYMPSLGLLLPRV